MLLYNLTEAGACFKRFGDGFRRKVSKFQWFGDEISNLRSKLTDLRSCFDGTGPITALHDRISPKHDRKLVKHDRVSLKYDTKFEIMYRVMVWCYRV